MSIGPIPCCNSSAEPDLEKERMLAPHRIIGVAADIDDEYAVPPEPHAHDLQFF